MNNGTIRPAATTAPIDLTGSKLADGPAGGGKPRGRRSGLTVSLVVSGIQAILLGAFLPLPGPHHAVVMLAGATLLVVALIVHSHHSMRVIAYSDQRLIITRWLAAHAPFDYLGCEELGWGRAFEIGEGQYEFRSIVNRQSRSLIIDLNAKLASVTVA